MIKFRWGTKAFLTEVCGICIQVFFRVTLRQQRDTNHTWRRGPHLLCNYAFVSTWKDWKDPVSATRESHVGTRWWAEEKTSGKDGQSNSQWGCPKQFPPFHLEKLVLFLNHMSFHYYIFHMTCVLTQFYLGQRSDCSHSLILNSPSQIFSK